MSDLPFPASRSDLTEPPASSGAGTVEMLAVVAMPVTAMRARRHPGALFCLWAWQIAFALLVSGPAAALVHAACGAHPRGDEPIWEPGGGALLGFLLRNAHGTAALVREAEIVLIGSAISGLLPVSAAMFAMAYAQPNGRALGCVRSLAAALQALPRLIVLLVVVAVAQAIVVGTGIGAAGALQSALHDTTGEATAQQLGAAVGIGGLGLASAFGVVHDLARAAIVRFNVTPLRGLGTGLRALRSAPVQLSWSWGWRVLASFAPILIAGEIEGLAGVEGSVFALLLLHQSVIVTRGALHLSWLATVLRSLEGKNASLP